MIGLSLSAVLLINSCWSAPQPQANERQLNANPNFDSEACRSSIGTTTTTTTAATNINALIDAVWGTSTSNNDCVCVPYYLCKVDGTISVDGDYLLDIRQKTCKDTLSKCCTPPNQLPEEKAARPAQRPFNEQRKCGQRNSQGIGFRIVGANDSEAEFGEFPWMVAILSLDNGKQNATPFYRCGGALVHPRIVLTAAHCIHKYNNEPAMLKIRAGEWDTQTKYEVLPHQDRSVSKVITHENYHKGTLHNDFGLLILSEPVDLGNENVGVVCLPQANDNFDHSRCLASGWGKDNFGKQGKYQVILKRVELPLIPRDQCQSVLRTTRLGNYYTLDDSFVCAGGEAGKDTCKGDGGSPLVCPTRGHPGIFTQAGIVAWGIGCGENQVPGVYANVAAARTWIDQQMRYAGINLNEYQSN